MLKNHCIIESKKDNDLLKNIYENCTINKPLNEELIFDYLRQIQTKIKEINNIIKKNNYKYLEYNSKPIKFYSKKIFFSLSLIILTILILYGLRYCYIEIFT